MENVEKLHSRVKAETLEKISDYLNDHVIDIESIDVLAKLWDKLNK
tara:strand:+ start:24 stop:161 length:138 start_codon:yes stop_codon:yes gene_type:complete